MTDLKCDFYTEAKQSEKYKNNRGCLRSRNPLTAKGPKRLKIARWAILAKGPGCSAGVLRKVRKVPIAIGIKTNALSLRPL